MKTSTINWLLAAAVTIGVGACAGLPGPDAQTEAQDVNIDAQTAAMQSAIDSVCGHLDPRTQLACAVDALAELQPDRWTPEDVERGHAAAALAGEQP